MRSKLFQVDGWQRCLTATLWCALALAPTPSLGQSGPSDAPLTGTSSGINRYSFSAHNPPPQPQVEAGRCAPCTVAVDCADTCAMGTQTWGDLHRYNFQPLAHGEHLGPIRLPSTIDYRVRVGDRIRFVYVLSRELLSDSFKLQVGDELQISSNDDDTIRLGDLVLGRGIVIQPDGMLYLPHLGQVRAAGLTIPQLRRQINLGVSDVVKKPKFDVIPISTNTLLEDIRSSVDARAGNGGQSFSDNVHPDGTLRLPKLGALTVQGMTLDELKREVNLQYRQIVSGLEVEPILDQEAQHFVFVYGKVGRPDRYQLNGPTSITQALAMAQGITVGGNRREIVIFRRAEDWRLLATRIDIKGAHLGKVPLPTDEIWLRDNDLIIVPPTPISRFDDFVDQVFTRGIYGVLPFSQIGEGFNANAFQN
ncbi:polysaccharide biosynthesis/export family protein [Aureliella helgolandensis]|uniref:Polysaccharide biosynthesis/export protein n=1 Tax=Aureliella helgolandensis TaxID=2527968 RepID=A0A518GE49_9BACT|nr:polysaccharide biosynthesis/export family protein [Aureliella helgolandensis]QDV26875.1 Polysaccharide biosynthesis/export protein [Aureliella helgolandensis]